jgi:ubiquinone/menaquinone biosynthesis C-methylase UbiE
MKSQDQETVSDTATDETTTLEKVRNYYDTMNAIIVQDVGKTYQAGTLITNTQVDEPYRATNLYLAAQAGIQAGQHVLDAGCGVCGPSIDIVQSIGDLKVDAITLSTAQAETAKKLIHEAGLTEKIQVHIGDYHHLPFADETFDVVFFFESTGYSYDQQKLFTEAYRVLKKGGKLYIKDVFSKEPPLSEQEQQEILEFNRVYAQYQTPCLSETVEKVLSLGFHEVTHFDLNQIMSLEEFRKAMFEYKYGFPLLTEFGKVHYRSVQSLPVFFAEIKAYKPSQ